MKKNIIIIFYVLFSCLLWLSLYCLKFTKNICQKEDIFIKFDNSKIQIEAENFDSCGQSGRKERIENHEIGLIASNDSLNYNIELKKGGLYRIYVNARNNKPAPILLKVEFSDKLQSKILSFDRDDDKTWETKSVTLFTGKGIRTLSVWFINDYYAPPLDRNAYIDWIEVEKWNNGEIAPVTSFPHNDTLRILKKTMGFIADNFVAKIYDFYIDFGKVGEIVLIGIVIVLGIILMIWNFQPGLILGLVSVFIPFGIYRDLWGNFTVNTVEVLLISVFIVGIWKWIRKKKRRDPEFPQDDNKKIQNGNKEEIASLLNAPRNDRLVENKWLYLSVFVFIAGILLSYISSKSLSSSIKETVKWLEIFVVYFFVMKFIKTKKEVNTIISLTFISGLIISIIGIVQFIISKYDYFTVQGTFGQHNPFAAYLGLMVPLALSLFIGSINYVRNIEIASPSVRNDKSGFLVRMTPIIFKIINGLVFFVLLVGLIVSFSRGAWIGFSVSALVLVSILIYRKFIKIPILIFIGFLAICVIVGTYILFQHIGFLSRIKDIFDKSQIQGRVGNYLNIGLKMFKDKPIFGQGIGNYKIVLPAYISNPNEFFKAHLHNLYLQILVEIGIVGLLGFLFFVGTHLWYGMKEILRPIGAQNDTKEGQDDPPSLKLRRASKKIASVDGSQTRNDNWVFAVKLGLLCAIVAYLIHNSVDVLTTHSIGLLFGMEMALLVKKWD